MTAAPSDPAEWSRVARAKHRHYLQTVVPSGNKLAIGLHERRLAAMVPLLCDAIDAARASARREAAEELWAEAERLREEDWPKKCGIEYVNGWEDASARLEPKE